VTLAATDFAWFRGGAKEQAGTLEVGRAQQFQMVPTTRNAQGTGSFCLDGIRLLPGGPAWTAEPVEQHPRREPAELEHERLCDALGRWQAEIARLTAEVDRTRRWLADIEALAADWQDPGRHLALRGRLEGRSCAWQQPPPICRGPVPVPGFSLDDYRRQVAGLVAPAVPLVDLGRSAGLTASRLYSAPEQEVPSLVAVEGQVVLRHRIRFSAEKARQVVFTHVALPAAADLGDRRLLLRLRCAATGLNPETPFLLRLHTDSGGAESWADFEPSVPPGPGWQELSFDTATPYRQTRGNPAATLAIALRFENAPGVPAEFDVEVADLRVAPPEPAAVVRRALLGATQDRVGEARDRLAALRDRIAELEDRLRAEPELRALYLASFENPAVWAIPPATVTTEALAEPLRTTWKSSLQLRDTGGSGSTPTGMHRGSARVSTPVDDALAGLALPQKPIRPARFTTACVPGAEGVEAVIGASGLPEDGELAASVLGPDATLLASGRARGASPSLHLTGLRAWAPGEPWRYRLRLAAVAGDQILAYDERDVGLRTSAVVPGGPTPLLRHVTCRRQPDWTFLVNGQCWFPRLTVYHWPEPEKTELAGARMLGDLWLDGLRFYGLNVSPATWERFDRCGLALLSGLAPGYRSLESWDDVAPWEADYVRACRSARVLRDRPAQIAAQVGNEVELTAWGASLGPAFPDAPYQPLDRAAAVLRREWDPPVPIMYVRAGSFREVPPLPHEQISGVNQYTGRYGGRLDEIGRDLAELARHSLWADRPLMITEWMGPKYSWATGGVGGVSPRGAAYYLERYWRAMTATPGIVGSVEFTLNWVIAPFEDLTNQTREEAWRDRPRHDPFGGGHTADHVPVVGPGQADRAGPCFRAMQAFQSPLYTMANSPGSITLSGAGAEGLAAALAAAGADVRVAPASAEPDLARAEGHLVFLRPVGEAAAFPPGATEPVLQTRLNPACPDLLVTTLEAPTAEARERGLARLVAAAEALGELREQEGAMSRALVLTDAAHVQTYAGYLLEVAGRGYLFSGDDVRTEFDPGEFLDDQGSRRSAWETLSAVVLDCGRALREPETELVRELARQGANVLIAANCYAANPRLRELLPATLTPGGTLADHFSLADPARRPLPVSDLGGAEIERIRRFRADLAESPGLKVSTVSAEGVESIAATAAGTPVIVRKSFGAGNLFLLGVDLGAAVEIHRRVTHAGSTHPLYDRDTACGLERLSRVAVNLCRFGCAEQRLRPQLVVHLVPEKTRVASGEALRGTVLLTDLRGSPVAGEVRARVRVVQGGRTGASGPYVGIPVTGAVPFEVNAAPAAGATLLSASAGLAYTVPAQARSPVVVSVQVKAYASGFVPGDAAIAFVLAGAAEPKP
jgi:hypothetical protein